MTAVPSLPITVAFRAVNMGIVAGGQGAGRTGRQRGTTTFTFIDTWYQQETLRYLGTKMTHTTIASFPDFA